MVVVVVVVVMVMVVVMVVGMVSNVMTHLASALLSLHPQLSRGLFGTQHEGVTDDKDVRLYCIAHAYGFVVGVVYKQRTCLSAPMLSSPRCSFQFPQRNTKQHNAVGFSR
jgi:hypothetical protein